MVNGWLYVEIQKDLYGLPHVGLLANKLLTKCLLVKGFYPFHFTTGLWWHVWWPILLVLVVDDFGIKYTRQHHATYLLVVICKHFEISVEWEETLFCDIHFTWDYMVRHVNLTMPQYIWNELIKSQHPHPTSPQHSSHKETPIAYGNNFLTTPNDAMTPLMPKQIKRAQLIIGAWMYYTCMVDPTLACALNSIATKIHHGTQAVVEACRQSSIMSPLIQMQQYETLQGTWFYMYIWMPATSPITIAKALLEGTVTSWPTI